MSSILEETLDKGSVDEMDSKASHFLVIKGRSLSVLHAVSTVSRKPIFSGVKPIDLYVAQPGPCEYQAIYRQSFD